jgi:LPXTG-motif cell wall-anchored protein
MKPAMSKPFGNKGIIIGELRVAIKKTNDKHMKKLIIFALLGMMLLGGAAKVLAQPEDSAKVAEDANDTISIDKMDPTFYEDDQTAQKSSNTATYAVIGGIVVIAGVAYYFIRKKKKQD